MSTTNGAEAHALAAGRAVLNTYRSEDVLGHQHRLVARVAAAFRQSVSARGLSGVVDIHAATWRVVTVYRDADGLVSTPLRTLMLQEMIRRGVLFQGLFMPCYQHTDGEIAKVTAAFDDSCAVYRQALERGVEQFLVGEPTRPVFRKYNGCRQVCPSTPCPLEKSCVGQSQ